MGNKSNSLLAFLIGAATGGVLGLLFAPDTGTNTRDKLTYLLDKYRKELQDLSNRLMAGEVEPESLAKEKGKKVISDARKKAEKLLEDVDDLIGQIKGEQIG